MKNCVLLFFLLTILNAVSAFDCQAGTYSLKITDQVDNEYLFLVDESLEIEITNDSMRLFSNQNNNEFLLNDLKKVSYHLDEIAAGIEDLAAAPITISLDSDSISLLSSSQAPTHFQIYSLSGHQECNGTFSIHHNIQLDTFTKGVYILKIGLSKSFKFIVK